MEDGEQQFAYQHSSSGQCHLPYIPADPVRQPRNGDPHESHAQHGTNEGEDEDWHLSRRPFFIVPIHADLLTRYLCRPPGQQVLELQVTAYMSVKCGD